MKKALFPSLLIALIMMFSQCAKLERCTGEDLEDIRDCEQCMNANIGVTAVTNMSFTNDGVKRRMIVYRQIYWDCNDKDLGLDPSSIEKMVFRPFKYKDWEEYNEAVVASGFIDEMCRYVCFVIAGA